MKVYNLESALKEPEKVTHLYLHNRAWQSIPEEVYQCKNLQVLDVSKNRLRELPEQLLELEQLEHLNLSENQFAQIPSLLSQFSNLRVLQLAHNQIMGLPENEATWPENLEQLDLNHNSINSLVLGAKNWKKLQNLSLAHNQITRLPRSFFQCRALRRVHLSNNRLKRIPAAIKNWGQLKRLDISQNRLGALPDELGQCETLEYLDLHQNKLAQIPVALGQLKHLEYLNLEENKLLEVPAEIGTCKGLRLLLLGKNQLKDLPPALLKLSYLQQLDLSKNQIRSLPPTWKYLQRLKELRIAHNQLSALPDELGQLTGLRLLNVNYNQLQGLPETLLQGISLEVLKFKNNPFQVSTTILLPLQKLKRLESNLPREEQKQFLQFLHHIRKRKWNLEQSQGFYALLGGEQTETIKQDILLAALQFPLAKVQRTARHLLLKRHSNHLPLQAGSVLCLLGNTYFDRQKLQRVLEKQQIQLVRSAGDRITHLLLGRSPKNIPNNIPGNWSLLSEQELFALLDQDKYLHQASVQQLENLRRMLLSRQEKTIALGLELLENGGVPKQLLTAIYLAYRTLDDSRLRKRLRVLLLLSTSPEMETILKSLQLIAVDSPPEKWKQVLTRQPEPFLQAVEIVNFFQKES